MPWNPRSGFTRIACNDACEIEGAGAHWTGVVWNISVLGVYVVMRPGLAGGETVTLSFRLPGDPQPIETTSRVAWVNPPSRMTGMGEKAISLPPGVGFEFVDLAPGDRQRIAARIEAASHGPGKD